MKYFRIGYCPPSPGPNGSPYSKGIVRAFGEKELWSAIKFAEANPELPIYMKPSYGERYVQITMLQLHKYFAKNLINHYDRRYRI